MNWTFGIITDGQQDHLLKQSIDSIQREVPHAQLIVVGGSNQWQGMVKDYHFIDFDDSQHEFRKGWITRKKNLVAQAASYDNLCILHDYIALGDGWYEGVVDFGGGWLTCMHRILNTDNTRYRDWCMISNDAEMSPRIDQQPSPQFLGSLLNYNNNTWGRWQYLSGAYFCVKRQTIIDVPFDEKRLQNDGEDVQWSRLLYQRYGQRVFTMNLHAYVKLLKYKPPVSWQEFSPL